MMMSTVELTRNAVIQRIKASLKRRSGKAWSVTGGRGTAYGWITITSPPARCKFDWDGTGPQDNGFPSLAERQELGRLLGLDGPVHMQGERVPASTAYYYEYLDRADGVAPRVKGQPYWD